MSTERFDKVIARADRVMQQLDERDGAVRACDDLVEALRAHLLSIGISGEVAPSSFPWFTPSARAI